jgi:hypothetical protein
MGGNNGNNWKNEHPWTNNVPSLSGKNPTGRQLEDGRPVGIMTPATIAFPYA